MILRFWFSRITPERQVSFMKKRGVRLGKRWRGDRQVYIYMYRDIFLEVVYEDDNVIGDVETVKVLQGLEELNNSLQKEIRSSF